MPVRQNIVTSSTARNSYVQGALALKAQFTGVTTTTLGIPGPNRPVSTWDRFVAWHGAAMGEAHQTPLFLPWHRLMLRSLEILIAEALGEPDFGLPYWDWAADGDLPTQAARLAAPVWNDDCMGSAAEAPGPFAFDVFPVRLHGVNVGGFERIRQTDRPLQRNRSVGFPPGLANPGLPRRADTAAVLLASPYDTTPWTLNSPSGLRNRLEGWMPANQLHNLVHIWIGGDMAPSSSPNDPAFYLNHCNIDRIWERWMVDNSRTYLPDNSSIGAVAGQRLNDPIRSPFGALTTPAAMLDMTGEYSYDSVLV